MLASVYNNYKVQLKDRAIRFHRKRRLGLAAAFKKLDTNKSNFVRIGSCARVLNELSRPNVSMFHWEKSAFLETQRTRAILQSWWDKAVENLERDDLVQEKNTSSGAGTVDTEIKVEGQHSDSFSSLSSKNRITRPVDDLIPLDAFIQIMISVRASLNEDKNISNSSDRKPSGVLYNDSIWCCRKVGVALTHRLFDWSVGAIVILNTVIIIVQADVNAQIAPGGKASSALELCELLNNIFGYFYVAELILKVLILGGSKYWERLQHRFDALTVGLVIAGQIAVHAAIAHKVPLSDISQYVLLLRLTRTLRLVVLVRRFNEIFAIFVDLLPAFSTLFGMMWTVFSIFASVGMVFFGGKIRYSSKELNGTEYAESNYYANNFNDFASSLVTLFELLVVNNWQVLMEGFIQVTSPFYRWFFICFWSIAVVVILNLVVAFILEAFFAKEKELKKLEMGDSNRPQDESKNSPAGKQSSSPFQRRATRKNSLVNIHEGFY